MLVVCNSNTEEQQCWKRVILINAISSTFIPCSIIDNNCTRLNNFVWEIGIWQEDNISSSVLCSVTGFNMLLFTVCMVKFY